VVVGGHEENVVFFLSHGEFSRTKIFVVGENVKPSFFFYSAIILKGCP